MHTRPRPYTRAEQARDDLELVLFVILIASPVAYLTYCIIRAL